MKTNYTNKLRATISALFLMVVTTVFAQITVQGTVLDDANNEPIIGASILEVGTTNGTITDWDGNFNLTVQSGANLQISYMGYKTITVAAQPQMNLRMKEDSELIDEVVVVGYGVVKKNDATGSVTAIKPDEMNKGLQTNAQDMLQGKIAGVNVVASDGTPGGAGTIVIRGGSSLNASTAPLIVIDGLAMDNNGIQGVANPLSMVNPNDIETFTVLKDASATAIYGSRASGGVIIITTKKGSKGSKPKVSYNGNVSFGTLNNRLEVLTGDEIRAYATVLGHDRTKTSTLGIYNTDWQDQVYRTAISTDHNISVAGGLKNMPYRFSLGYTNQNGIIKTSNMQRVTLAASLNPSFLDNHLNFNVNLKGMYIYNRYADGGVVGGSLEMDPTMPIKGGATNIFGETLVSDDVINNYFSGYYQRIKDATYGDSSWPYTYNAQTTGNPVDMLNSKNDRANSGAFVGNVEADYQIHGFEDLRIHANFGADYSYGKQNTTISPYSRMSHYYGWDGFTQKDKYNLQFSATIQYYKDFSETQHFDAMIGYENQYFFWKSNSDGWGLYPDTNNDPTLRGTYYNRNPTVNSSDVALQSWFGRINWNGWNKILLTANFRADGSSRFAKTNSKGKNARWGLFPAVSLAWKIKETFLEDVNSLDELKLRLGYGITGQQELGMDYYYMPSYTNSQAHAYYPIGTDEIAVPGTDPVVYYNSRPGAYNPDLTWEKTTTYNVGLDFSVLRNRVSGNVDYYYRYTDDLLSYVNVSIGSNFRNQMWANIGSLSNMGVEAALNGVIIDRKNFKWDIGVNVAWNKNRIVSLVNDDPNYYVATGGISSGTGNNVQAQKVGYAARSFYVYETHKYDVDGKQYWAVVDRNKDGQISSDDKYIYKSPDAKVTVGLQTKFQFYGFDLGISLRSHIGNYVYNDVLASKLQWVVGDMVYQTQNGGYHGVLRNAFNTYYNEGMQSNNMKALLWNSENGTYNEAGIPANGFNDWYMSDYFVENASFLRIDNITLGYTFDKTKHVTGRVFCTISNPYVFSKYRGLDPEVGGGIDNNMYPRSMTTIVGVSLNF